MRPKSKKPTTYKGTKFRSHFEIHVAKQLESANVPTAYEDTELPYVLEKVYRPDFRVLDENDTITFIEAKGYFDGVARTKMLAVKKAHPDVRIILLFERDIKLSKRSTMRVSEWAEKHGFEWSIGTLKPDWIKEWQTPKNKKNSN